VEGFPANSREGKRPVKSTGSVEKTEEKKIERVVESEVVRRKKPLGKRFLETFIGGDAKSVAHYVLFDVLLPAAKDTVADAVSQGIERMLFGEVRSTSRRTGAPPGGQRSGYTSYNRFSANAPSRREDPRGPSRQNRATHNFDEIILATRVEATEVIDRLFDLVSQYDSATVADLYELVGISGNYTDEKWGWSDIRGAGVTRVRNGYLLDLPKPEPLD
jgi:hypothetical protein